MSSLDRKIYTFHQNKIFIIVITKNEFKICVIVYLLQVLGTSRKFIIFMSHI